MDRPRIAVETDGAVATVWLDRPDKLNGVDLPMLDGLLATARELRTDRSVRVVLLRGRGDSFCAGLDFAAVQGQNRLALARRLVPSPLRGTNSFQEAVWAWRRLAVPVIAVTQGHVYGAGLQLALAADFRFTTPDAQWSVLEARWGLVPDMSGTVSLGELVRADVAKRLTYTGEVISGERAAELGLATGAVDDPLAAARELAAAVASRSPDSVAASKRLLDASRRGSIRGAFGRELRAQLRMLRSPNTRRAQQAARRSEPPSYADRTL